MFSIKRLTSKLLLAALAIIAISLIAACASDDESAAEQPAANSESQEESNAGSSLVSSDAASADLTVATEQGPPEVAVVPAEIPEPGSIEEKVLKVLEKQVVTTNTRDYTGFLETCQPDRHIISVEQLEHIFVEFGGEFGYDIPSFSIDGYNARNVDFTVYSTENVRTTFDIYDYDQWVATGVSRTWVNVEGEWYSDGLTCHGIGG